METPEYVEGIPTEKKKVKERFDLIKSYYEKLWKDLQRETGSNFIHNKFLDAIVYIVKTKVIRKQPERLYTTGNQHTQSST